MNAITDNHGSNASAPGTRARRARKAKSPETSAPEQEQVAASSPNAGQQQPASRPTLGQALKQRWREFFAPAGSDADPPTAPTPAKREEPSAPSPAAAETPATEKQSPDIQQQLPLPLATTAPEPETAIPLSLQKRYFIGSDNKYYFRDRQQALAFEDLGQRLRTAHDDPEVAVSMVELAQAKGWTQLKLSGSATFKREAWLAAAERGLQVSGYQPSPLDKARLEERLAQREAEQHGKGSANQIGKITPTAPEPNAAPAKRQRASKQRTKQTTPAAPVAGREQPPAVPQHSEHPVQINPQQQAAVAGLKSFLRQRGDSNEAIEMTAAIATQALTQHRAHFGELIEHGAARYQHNPESAMNYYVTLRTPQGRQTIWGVDLQRTLADNGVAIGDGIVLVQPDHRPVTVTVPERDDDGKATGKRIPISADRNRWEILSLDNARDFLTTAPPASPPKTRDDNWNRSTSSAPIRDRERILSRSR